MTPTKRQLEDFHDALASRVMEFVMGSVDAAGRGDTDARSMFLLEAGKALAIVGSSCVGNVLKLDAPTCFEFSRKFLQLFKTEIGKRKAAPTN